MADDIQGDLARESGPGPHPDALFFEPGASWYWLLAGPLAALAMVYVQYSTGMGLRPLVPLMFLLAVSGFLALQVKAGRIHTSVELTGTSLREGTEVLPVSEILEVFDAPEFTKKSDGPLEKWQSARALGELSDVPRGRIPIGLRLTGNRLVRAWARDADGLHEQLVRLVQAGPG